MRRFISFVLVAFAVLAFAQYASAALISGVTATATSEMTDPYFDRLATHTVDGSGLHINGLDTHSSVAKGTMWRSEHDYDDPTTTPTIQFDLGGAYDLASLKVWNYNHAEAYTNGNGIKTMNIEVSSDNGSSWTDMGSFSLTKAPGDGTPYGKDILAFGDELLLSASNVTNVQFTNLVPWDITMPNGAQVGLSEVQYFGFPSSPSFPGDANRDGRVDDEDATILADNWLQSGGWSSGDFNDDGIVNDIDATILATNWQVGSSASVPEPGVFVLLIGLLLGCVLARNRRAARATGGLKAF